MERGRNEAHGASQKAKLINTSFAERLQRKTLVERLVGKYAVDPGSGCWIWHAAGANLGKPQVFVDGKTHMARRVAYQQIGNKALGAKDQIRSICGTVNCINPDHLDIVGSIDLEAFFRARYKVDQVSECWNWTGYNNAYVSQLMYKGSTLGAARQSWVIHVGEIPLDKIVVRKCGNKKCVNPDHLKLGDISPDPTSKHHLAQGEDHHRAVLTEETVRSIRNSLEAGTVLAKRYGVSSSTITNVRKRHTWKHVL